MNILPIKYLLLHGNVSAMLWLLVTSTLVSCGTDNFQLQEGDLLFQDSDCGVFCDAIEKVTTGYNDANLSHIGIVVGTEHGFQVVEAISEGVVYTDVSSFLNRSHDVNGRPKVIVGRMKPKYSNLISKAVTFVKSQIGMVYDEVFVLNNNKFYCSELLYEAFKNANKGKAVFQLFPMTFVDPDTEETFLSWGEYYEELKVDIPEGKPGLNPGGISRSAYIDIIHVYGVPSGMNID